MSRIAIVWVLILIALTLSGCSSWKRVSIVSSSTCSALPSIRAGAKLAQHRVVETRINQFQTKRITDHCLWRGGRGCFA